MFGVLPVWAIDALACPSEGCWGPLRSFPDFDGVDDRVTFGRLGCRRCGAHYPVLAGIPILVPDPVAWMGALRESVLATLAEFNVLSPTGVALIGAFAARAGAQEPRRFEDDWVAAELDDEAVEPAEWRWSDIGDPEFQSFLSRGDPRSLHAELLDLAGPRRKGLILEVGCGAGGLSALLAGVSDHFILSDFSLRAVCTAGSRLERAGRTAVGVVLDAQSLPLIRNSARLIVAENLVDLLDSPDAFFTHAARVLTRRGRLLISTPDPDFEALPSADPVRHVMAQTGFLIEREALRRPWVRVHHDRYVEVYFVDVILACRGSVKKRNASSRRHRTR